MILSLEFLHSNGYIYRNLTPDNILFNDNGYPLIADFKPIREFTRKNYSDTGGSPGYMAPEYILRQNYSFYSDFFSLGVIAYEMMFKKLPYPCKSRQDYIEILTREEIFIRKNDEFPNEWSLTSVDFINRCLIKNFENRLGFNGIHEVKDHKWFEDINWDNLMNMKVKAPFVPEKGKTYLNKPNKKQGKKYTNNIKEHIERIEMNEMFRGYYYDYNICVNDTGSGENLDELYKYIDNEIKRIDIKYSN